MSYRIEIKTVEEEKALYFLSERYESARLLIEAIENANTKPGYPYHAHITEHDMWEILDTTETEGERGLIPCLGGELGERIHKIFASVI
jgi:hypothetical protein